MPKAVMYERQDGSPPPKSRADLAEEAIAQLQLEVLTLQTKTKKMEAAKKGTGITKEAATAIFDVVKQALDKLKADHLEVHRDTLKEMRSAAKSLEAVAAVQFDSAAAILKSRALEFAEGE